MGKLKELFIPNELEWKEMTELAVFSEWFEKHFGSDYELFERCCKAYRLWKSEFGLGLFIKIVSTSKYGTEKEIRKLKKLLKEVG